VSAYSFPFTGHDEHRLHFEAFELWAIAVHILVLYNCFMQFIPKTARSFFQEFDFEQIDAERDGDLIIERLLAYGNRNEVRWLLKQFGPARIRKWLSEGGVRRLPRRRYRLWCVLWDVPMTLREPAPIWPY
jgi:hypothetical protein